MVSQDDVVSGIPGSDHEAIPFSVRCVKSKVVRHNHVSGGVTYNFKKADFSHCLSVISWNCCFLSGDVDDVLTNFKDLVFTTADQCKPKIMLRHRKWVHWLSAETLRQIRRDSIRRPSDQGSRVSSSNSYFCPVFTKENANLAHLRGLLQSSRSVPSIDEAECNVDEVYEELCTIDPGSLVAQTRFLVIFWERGHHGLLNHLPCCSIIMSLRLGVLPLDWRRAITPVFKKGNRHSKSNYCSVSLTRVVIKCLKRLVRSRISEFLNVNNKLSAWLPTDSGSSYYEWMGQDNWQERQHTWMNEWMNEIFYLSDMHYKKYPAWLELCIMESIDYT